MFVMAAEKELIGHAGNVIAYDDVTQLRVGELFVRGRHGARRVEVVHKEFLEAAHGAVAVFGDGGMIVDVLEEEVLEAAIMLRCVIAKASEAMRGATDIVNRDDAGILHANASIKDEIAGQEIDDAADGFAEDQFFAGRLVS